MRSFSFNPALTSAVFSLTPVTFGLGQQIVINIQCCSHRYACVGTYIKRIIWCQYSMHTSVYAKKCLWLTRKERLPVLRISPLRKPTLLVNSEPSNTVVTSPDLL